MACRFLLATCSLAEKWRPTVDPVNGHYPLGMASLYAVAEQAGHSVDLLYLVAEPQERCTSLILDTIREKDIQVLGLSVITDNRVASFRTIEAVLDECPQVRVILGGIHVSVMYEQILTRYPQVIAVRGEGEETLVDLLDAIETGRDLATVPGIAFWRGDGVVTTGERVQIADLDTLPMPRHDLFFTPERTCAQLMTSRGCPFTCSFCVLDSVSRRKVRFRTAKSVVDEIEMILANHPQAKHFHVYDDQFFANNKRVIEICDEIVRRGIKAHFLCQGRVKPISRELVLALERAGFTTVILGLESGSPEVLKRCNKKIELKDVERALSLFAGTSIEVSVLLIIGLPGETESTLQETIDFCQTLQKIKYHVYDNRIQDLFVYPGTEIYRNCQDAGRIDDDFWLKDGDCPRFELDLDGLEYLHLRNRLLDGISIYRLFTEDGFQAQRALIPTFLRYLYGANTFALRYRECFEGLVQNALLDALARKRIEILGHPEQVGPGRAFSALNVLRRPGDESALLLNLIPFPNGLNIPDLVAYAYRNRVGALTDAFDRAIIAYMEEAFATGNGQLERVTPHDAMELRIKALEEEVTVAAHQTLAG